MGYREINFWKYIMASAVVLIPAAILEREDERWAQRYTVLILLMMVVTQWDALARFSTFVQKEMRF